MLSAADDPIASARALEVTQSQSINAQFATNRANARSSLSQEEVALTGVQTLIQDVQTIAVAAGNGANSASDRATYANELQGRLDDLIALANSVRRQRRLPVRRLPVDHPCRSSDNTAGVDYHGDQGQVQLQVASSRKVAISDAGSSVFDEHPDRQRHLRHRAPAPPMPAPASISAGTVSDPRQLTGHNYSIDFSVVAGTPAVTTYTRHRPRPPVPPTPVPARRAPYTSGAPITVGGMKFDIPGSPADGDKFSVAAERAASRCLPR